MERVVAQAPPNCAHHRALHWGSNNKKLTVQETQDAVGKGVEQAVAYQGGGVDAQQLHSKGASKGEKRVAAAEKRQRHGAMSSSCRRVIARGAVLRWNQLVCWC